MSSAKAGRKKSKDKSGKKDKKGAPEEKQHHSDQLIRTEIVRSPNGLLTDWSGVFLDTEIRSHIRVRARACLRKERE